MNTPAHVLLVTALAAKPDARSRNTALICGALFPDMMMFVMVAWERFVNGLSAQEIFRDAYFSDFWQEIFAINNSAPIFTLIILAGLVTKVEWLWAFGLAALLHAVFDFPLHHNDGHPHFWPLTDWVYVSPVSYWDPRHHGVAAGVVEAVISVVFAGILWSRFSGYLVRVAIVVWLLVELLFSVGSHLIYG